jgi:hypothetical protein
MNNFVKLVVSGCIFTRLVSDAVAEWATSQSGPVVEALVGLRNDFMQAAQEEGLPEHFEQVGESWTDAEKALKKLGKGIGKVFASAEEEV